MKIKLNFLAQPRPKRSPKRWAVFLIAYLGLAAAITLLALEQPWVAWPLYAVSLFTILWTW